MIGDRQFWYGLDRRAPVWLKLIVPVIAVTVLGTALFGYLLADFTRRNAESTSAANAVSTANAAATYDNGSINSAELSARLSTLIADEPDVLGVWIIDLSGAGSPVLASTEASASQARVLSAGDLQTLRSGTSISRTQAQGGASILVTAQPIAGGNHAVVVITSLQGESGAVDQTLLWIGAAGLAVCALEVTLLLAILEFGVFRRVRRMHRAVRSFGSSEQRGPLREGAEPPGRDVLFNLAREIDHKLSELDERERAGRVVADLGMHALQGVDPSELTAHALALLRDAASLERTLLVDTDKGGALLSTEGGKSEQVMAPDLAVWLSALAWTAAHSRRPLLAGRLGRNPRFWDGQTEPRATTAAFVPMPGKLGATGVMVGVAREGDEVSGTAVSLMEGVATALSQSLERQAAIDARRESEDKSNALATVSHEMRNPLNAMLGFSDLLLSGSAGQLTDKQHQYVEHVHNASRHLLELVNDYLDLARVMAGSLPMDVKAVEVGPEVMGVVELMGPTAADRQVVLRAEVAEGTIAHADRLRMRQVLINLVAQAIRSTPPRGQVRVQVAGGSNGVRISVIDTGAGIPADRQHLVFSEFAELRPGEASDGTGLGLALSKRFVDAMGGFIRFTSSEGSGTIFDVWLPGENSPHGDEVAAPAEQPLFR